MGSLESGLSLKRDSSYLLRSTSRNNNERQSQSPFVQRQQPRSRFARFLLFKKIDYYLLWICTVAVFLFFVVVFQMFLPGSVMDTTDNFVKDREVGESKDLMVLKEIGGLDFGEDVKFESSKLLHKFEKEGTEGNTNMSVGSRRVLRFGYRKPQLALVSFGNENVFMFVIKIVELEHFSSSLRGFDCLMSTFVGFCRSVG